MARKFKDTCCEKRCETKGGTLCCALLWFFLTGPIPCLWPFGLCCGICYCLGWTNMKEDSEERVVPVVRRPVAAQQRAGYGAAPVDPYYCAGPMMAGGYGAAPVGPQHTLGPMMAGDYGAAPVDPRHTVGPMMAGDYGAAPVDPRHTVAGDYGNFR